MGSRPSTSGCLAPPPRLYRPRHPERTALYRLLEEEVAPLWYDRDADGLPQGWLDRMREAQGTSLWDFSTTRMLAEYVVLTWVRVVP